MGSSSAQRRGLFLLFFILSQVIISLDALREFRSWSDRENCAKSQLPNYPYAYEKYKGQLFESKSRVNSNLQDFRHECTVRGGRSKCNICEEIDCQADDGTCSLQLQGVDVSNMSTNVPSLSDTAWAVGGSHRRDYGGVNVTHFCVFTSGIACASPQTTDFTNCSVRCFGYGFNRSTTSAIIREAHPRTVIDIYESQPKWPEDGLVDLWVYPANCSELSGMGGNCTYGGNSGKTPTYNPQGFTFKFAGSGVKGLKDGAPNIAQFNGPEDVQADEFGNVFVADTLNNAIRKVYPNGTVETVAGLGADKPGIVDGDCDIARFYHPKGIDVMYGGDDNSTLIVIVADTSNHRIRKITQTNASCIVECLTGLCGNNTLSFSEFKKRAHPIAGFADGPGLTSRFSAPESVAFIDNGYIVVADTGNYLLRMINLTGFTWTLAGKLAEGIKETDGSPLAGCPPPCLVGVQGYLDGNLTSSEFYNPLDVTRGPNNTVYIADEHRIRMLSLPNVNTNIYEILSMGTVVTLAGNSLQGQEDGRGDEATLFQPTGVVVTDDTIAYIADRSSCRLRRMTPLPLIQGVNSITCSSRADEVFRPSGCTSFDQITDKTGRKISRVEANIQYNYGAPYEADLDYGKRPKNCVGSPPPDTLDKHFIYQGDNLVVDDHNVLINEDSEAGLSIMLYCPSGCTDGHDTLVEGSGWYSDRSSICLSAIHSGTIDANEGGYLQITYERRAFLWNTDHDKGTTSNSITSTDMSNVTVMRVFSTEKYNVSTNIIHTVSGRPSAKLTSPCGYSGDYDQPSTLAMFDGPAGVTVRKGASLTNEEFIYIADANNNMIRASSATCTHICENGGSCVGPDICQCKTGWSGVDCTIPQCSSTCGANKVCVGPDICDCKPGYQGSDCLQPLCSQVCQNGGTCSAPDTCSCQAGWFDTNCTTPVCSQTCANGGNCTAYNTCSCPDEWSGDDCRIPVCTQECKNGGLCTAPNTCICPPQWIGHECHIPVCTQGFFRRNPTDEEKKGLAPRMYQSDILTWDTYKPCSLEDWCRATNEYECFQKEMTYDVKKLGYGPMNRKRTGRKEPPFRCMIIELPTDYKIPFQLEYADGVSQEGIPTNYSRYTPNTPYESDPMNVWRGYTEFTENRTGPWTYVADRQLARVDWLGVSQGVYSCANGGNCTAPDVCQCAPGWIGFDCRTPVCTQGYYKEKQETYVSGLQTVTELIRFERFLGNNSVRLDWPYSNKNYSIMIENYTSPGHVERVNISQGGVRYLGLNYTSLRPLPQGGYRCSIRAVTEWEKAEYVFEHPNYYSKYMDKEQQKDFLTYSHWENMSWPALHQKSRVLDQYFKNHTYAYTDEGYRRYGIWSKYAGRVWEEGICIMEFKRKCSNKAKELDLESGQISVETQDPDLSFRPRVYYDDQEVIGYGTRWVESDGECLDEVLRGCYNNGTCVAPETCQCATGWEGADCSVPTCSFGCQHNGNCTGPDQCTCERGWTSADCSVPMCAQECQNGGICVAPDTCKCYQFPNIFRDFRQGGGRPKFQKENGDPLDTGWTGFDCSTPICVQAETFVYNYDKFIDIPNNQPFPGAAIRRDPSLITNSQEDPPFNENYTSYGGRGGDGTMTCVDADGNNLPRCPQFNQYVTANDGTSFQTGCGYDPYDTGCCEYENEGSSQNLVCYQCPTDDNVVGSNDYNCFTGGAGDTPTVLTLSNGGMVQGGPNEPALQRFLDLDGNFKMCQKFHSPRNYPPYYPDAPSEGVPAYFRYPLDPRYSSYNYNSNITSNRFLCNVLDWTQGDYIDDAGMGNIEGVGSVFGLQMGRHVRTNNPNVITGTNEAGQKTFTQGPNIPGEGLYICYNGASCIGPDTCTCTDGYSGFDCNTPLCRHLQPSGKVTGCLNAGICISRDECECIQTDSQLYTVHPESARGLTGWTGTDCSIPMCIQGFFDPFCTDLDQAPAGQGCYRCSNGGNCTAPDMCTCAHGWTGYDCRTPVCEVVADPLTRMQLGTVFEDKVVAFESDPCGVEAIYGISGWKGRKYTRGNCSQPNVCTCLCRESYNMKACHRMGEQCEGPWQDPLSDFRNVLAIRGPEFIYGTQSCSLGHEGNVDDMDQFTTCHLTVYLPKDYERYTVIYLSVGVTIIFIVTVTYFFVRERLRKMYLIAKINRRKSRRSSEESLLQT